MKMNDQQKTKDELIKELESLRTRIAEDITTHKQDEEKLRISDLRLKMGIRASGIVIWDWNILTNELDWDDAYYQMFGYSDKDTLPTLKSWTDYIHPDDTEHTLDSLNKVVESGETQWVAEYRFKKKDGTYRFTQDWGTVIRNASGKPERMIGIMLDITEKKMAEKDLHESNERLSLALSASKLGFWDLNLATKKLDWCDNTFRLFDKNRKEFLPSFDTFAKFVHPEDLETMQTNFNNALVSDETPYHVAVRVINDSGREWIMEAQAKVIRNSEGIAMTILGTAQDITERKLTEANLVQQYALTNSGVESMPIAWILLDPELKIVEWNTAAETIFGWTKNEMIGEKVSRYLVPPEVSSIVDDVLLKLQKGETASYSDKDNNLRKDGSAITCKWYNSPICDENGKITAILILAEDITERTLIEEELLKARKLESVGLLAGGIAHDFNNILTGLFGNIELAKRKLPPDHLAYSYIENADQALGRATGLTKQLLTFAKGGDPILEVINIGQVIEDSIKFSLSGSNVKTSINVPADLWHVKADKGQLSQVITNLVINAKQAMPDGGVLTIDTENIANCAHCLTNNLPGECVSLTISDEGTGISQAYLEKIFDPYFTTKQTGSGLGLATVHSIINKHNGYISVDSEPGVGSTFTILLHADRSMHQSAETTTSGMTKKSVPISGHVLVMDDDEMILNLTTEIIETFGYTVDTAVDGKEAIEKYITAKKSGKAFDVVIMDLTIPGGMGGKDALQELLTLDSEVKVIVSSGYSTDPVMANYSEYGFKGRLVKPFQMDELQKELSLHIAQK